MNRITFHKVLSMKNPSTAKPLIYLLITLLLTSCSAGKSPAETPAKPAAENSVEQQEKIELHKLSDLDKRLAQVGKGGTEQLAQAIAEVDEWLYDSADESKARERIDQEIARLRELITKEIDVLRQSALKSANGASAQEHLMRVSKLLMLYPTPATDAQRATLDKLTRDILQTSQRVEEMRHLRYNDWAIKKVQSVLTDFHALIKVNNWKDLTKLVSTNKEALIQRCAIPLSEIDPAQLEPAVMDLYNYAYGLIRDGMGTDEQYLVKLAKSFADPGRNRKSPAEF